MYKKKIVIIGASYLQLPLVIQAKKMKFETHVFAWEEGAVAKSKADCFYPISIIEKEKILEKCKEIKPDGIISIASDLAILTVNYIADKMKLIGNSIYSTKVSTNKYEMRKIFELNNLPSPKFKLLNNYINFKNLNIKLPIIVKPIDRSGSRGITKIDDVAYFENATKKAFSVSFKKQILVEEFVEGIEYSIEMVSYNGEHRFLAITEKFTTGNPNFIEMMHLQPARIDIEIQNNAIKIIKKALNVLNIEYGASHSEIKVNNNGDIKIIEIGARMGGDFIGSDLVQISTGINFNEIVLDIALKKDTSFKQIPLDRLERKSALIKYIFNKNDIKILDYIKRNYDKNIYKIKETFNNVNFKINDSSQRQDYFIIQGNSNKECLDMIKIASKNIS